MNIFICDIDATSRYNSLIRNDVSPHRETGLVAREISFSQEQINSAAGRKVVC